MTRERGIRWIVSETLAATTIERWRELRITTMGKVNTTGQRKHDARRSPINKLCFSPVEKLCFISLNLGTFSSGH